MKIYVTRIVCFMKNTDVHNFNMGNNDKLSVLDSLLRKKLFLEGSFYRFYLLGSLFFSDVIRLALSDYFFLLHFL